MTDPTLPRESDPLPVLNVKEVGPFLRSVTLSGEVLTPGDILAIENAIEAAIRSRPVEEGDLENRARRIVERASTMGLCSQTHHEHLANDAAKVYDALYEPTEYDADYRALPDPILRAARPVEVDLAAANDQAAGDG